MSRKISISFDERGLGKVFVDGEELQNIVGLTFKATAGELPTLTLTLNCVEVITNAEAANVTISNRPQDEDEESVKDRTGFQMLERETNGVQIKRRPPKIRMNTGI